MAIVTVDLSQTDDIRYIAREGNQLSVILQWLEPGAVDPRDISGLSVFTQLVTNTADEIDLGTGQVLHTFSLVKDVVNGSYYTKDGLLGKVTVVLGDILTRSLSTSVIYYLEVKLVDESVTPQQNIDSLVISLEFKPEYARQP